MKHFTNAEDMIVYSREAENVNKIGKALVDIHKHTQTVIEWENVNSFFELSDDGKLTILYNCQNEFLDIEALSESGLYCIGFTIKTITNLIGKGVLTGTNELIKTVPALNSMLREICQSGYDDEKDFLWLHAVKKAKIQGKMWKDAVEVYEFYIENIKYI